MITSVFTRLNILQGLAFFGKIISTKSRLLVFSMSVFLCNRTSLKVLMLLIERNRCNGTYKSPNFTAEYLLTV